MAVLSLSVGNDSVDSDFIWEYRKSKEECERKKRQKFLLQFKEMIQSMAAALGTGYSVENAMKETQKELKSYIHKTK